MAKQDMMTAEEYKTYIINLSVFAKKYSLVVADLNIIDLTLENFPEIENKVITIKNKLGTKVEDVLTEGELQTLLLYLNKALKSYNKKFNMVASKIIYEKNATPIFYADFTIKKNYARKLFNLDKKGYEQISKLENSFYINIETVANILGINQDDLQLLIDRSITFYNENYKNKKD